MEALLAIAMLCQIHAGGFHSLKEVDQYQSRCQKSYIACYESKMPAPPADPSKWVGILKDCVKER